MTRNINVKIQDYQVEKIKRSGLTFSEYVRRSIDYYDEDVRTAVFMEILEFCKTQVNLDKGMVNNKFISTAKTGLKPEENKEKIYTNKEKIYTDKEKIYTDKELSGELSTNEVAKKLREKIPMLRRVLNNPANMNSLPDCTIKSITKEYNISKQSLNNFIEEFKTEIKEGKLE